MKRFTKKQMRNIPPEAIEELEKLQRRIDALTIQIKSMQSNMGTPQLKVWGDYIPNDDWYPGDDPYGRAGK